MLGSNWNWCKGPLVPDANKLLKFMFILSLLKIPVIFISYCVSAVRDEYSKQLATLVEPEQSFKI